MNEIINRLVKIEESYKSFIRNGFVCEIERMMGTGLLAGKIYLPKTHPLYAQYIDESYINVYSSFLEFYYYEDYKVVSFVCDKPSGKITPHYFEPYRTFRPKVNEYNFTIKDIEAYGYKSMSYMEKELDRLSYAFLLSYSGVIDDNLIKSLEEKSSQFLAKFLLTKV